MHGHAGEELAEWEQLQVMGMRMRGRPASCTPKTYRCTMCEELADEGHVTAHVTSRLRGAWASNSRQLSDWQASVSGVMTPAHVVHRALIAKISDSIIRMV